MSESGINAPDFVNVLQVVGYKNSGKTTWVSFLVNWLSQKGKKVATIKHDAHGFSLDQPNTDTWSHQQAGAALTLIQSPNGMGIISNHKQEHPLQQLIHYISIIDQYDMIIVEGYKLESYPKMLLIRNPADFKLLSLLEAIEVVLFWNEEDLKYYNERDNEDKKEQNGLRDEEIGSFFPTCPAFLIEDEEGIMSWMESYLSKEGKHG
ncbi:molybdopterin-guanine dinucleotide biosynthesis protein B [Bacillus horti]|nr:molybdopterin-guanine dinucleotide biosynthesis protein B [Bacillus horti]